ncbi:SMP-30/gluconolactonase/LRE family protein [Virgisporangium aliadipatigenens]|uniref:SMP-30/gluconolactonase/LRE family protein n=1 Tax=Virgisporangium aliadipatigenens TaxID=741659 RepID=UPI00194155A2|nr:SMP-30/gluconolactonase/LRE family protein [Virgisporangium aliadipatigenens]
MPRRLAVELIDPAGSSLGEGPAWDAAADCLVWVDILGQKVHLSEADGTRRATKEFDRHVGAALPAEDGGYLVVRRDGFARWHANDEITPLLDVLTDGSLRFNDAKCDPAGRAFAGTLCYTDGVRGRGELFRLDAGPKATPVRGPVSLANGLGWSPDGRLMYFIDTVEGTLTEFDYDVDGGVLTAPRVLVNFDGSAGQPDGMCVDDDGCLWVALWGGAAVHRFTPDGRLDTVLEVPSKNVTSCAFGPGGRLYVTTAAGALSPEERAQWPLAGGLFVAEPGAGGPAAVPWRPL